MVLISPLDASAYNSILTRTCALFIRRITHFHLPEQMKVIHVENQLVGPMGTWSI